VPDYWERKIMNQKAIQLRLIALAGPSGSGKTSLANRLAKRLGRTVIISQDQYYKDWSILPLKKREEINFDHPSSFDFALMKKQLKNLKMGDTIFVPSYSYRLHKRLKRKIKILPQKWIIVEGLLVICRKSLRDLFDLKIYLDIDKETALSRRIKRDLEDRGETVDSVCRRYFKDVLPMQRRFVEPQKNWADMVVDSCETEESRLLDRLVRALGKSSF